MARTAAQIVTLACQIAKCPGYTSQAGQLLNVVLDELNQTYNFNSARTNYSFNFDVAQGSGPYTLPSDYLRMASEGIWFTILGVKYPMVSVDLSEYDMMVQQPGLQAYPSFYATNMSTSPPTLFVWMPPSGAYPVTMRYYRDMPEITTPETSTDVPWFPQQNYLITRVAGELMKITDDTRADAFLGIGPSGAQGILTRFLKLEDDSLNRTQRVELDRRFFGRRTNLPNTKTIGW